MMLLNNREVKVFEREYQWLSNLPFWRMENILICGTFESKQLDKFARAVYTGRNKLNRLNIAAHETGHAIVMEATHLNCVGDAVIDVKYHPEGRLGWVTPYREHKEASEPIEQEGMPCKPLVIIDILMTSGGFVGQSLTGKKTGSNHEKFLIYCRCRYIDDMAGMEPITAWNHFVPWCERIILNNEDLFWRITDDLLANSELTESCKIFLRSRIRKEPLELFF
ncbi:MAG: hypothetical protein JSR32_10735 [Proteobacteria bacterium]|nr:hypothetical protein [Pseudomonadota bacterium]